MLAQIGLEQHKVLFAELAWAMLTYLHDGLHIKSFKSRTINHLSITRLPCQLNGLAHAENYLQCRIDILWKLFKEHRNLHHQLAESFLQ